MEEKKQQELLPNINFPADLRQLSLEQLPQLCQELRRTLIKELSVHPGHFASSLGVVELTVALHYVFNTPEDRLVWDVGHQAYVHKMLSGRRTQFHTNRQFGGLRPFPSPKESEYDTCTCGHASNSIGIALGMAVAAHEEKKTRHVVAIIGDGSMSGGLAYESLNNASNCKNDLLIILNDNNMSIDRSVGGMKNYLHQLHTGSTYNRIRQSIASRMLRWGWINEEQRKRIIRFNNSLKAVLNKQHNVFEGMSIRYFGPDDGHNVIQLVHTLRQIKDMKGPKLLHLHTTKGKGFRPAESDPTTFHAPGKFCPETGERLKPQTTEPLPLRYQDVFGQTLLELARQNSKIIGVTPAMPTGCSMCIMQDAMPDRVFDVGIAEGHAVTFSAGMAIDGLMPFCNIYSSFAQRAYDNIIHDVAISHLNLCLCFDRAGLVGEDGPTHHGFFDLAALRPIPGLTIASPLNEEELRDMMYTAQLPDKGPFVIRYPRGRGVMPPTPTPMKEMAVGKAQKLRDGRDVAVLSIGPLGNTAADAIRELEEEKGPATHIAHWNMRWLCPIDEKALEEVANTCKSIVTLEDGTIEGGLGSAVIEWMNDHKKPVHVTRLGLPKTFVEHGSVDQLHHLCGIDTQGIKAAIQKEITELNTQNR